MGVALHGRVGSDRQEQEETTQSQLAKIRSVAAADDHAGLLEFIQRANTAASVRAGRIPETTVPKRWVVE